MCPENRGLQASQRASQETWTFIVWVLSAGFIHAHATRGRRGRRASSIAFVGRGAVSFTFAVVNVFFKGSHAYSGLDERVQRSPPDRRSALSQRDLMKKARFWRPASVPTAFLVLMSRESGWRTPDGAARHRASSPSV